MLSLFIRNLFFTILQPGLVAGLIPFWIINYTINDIFEKTWLWYHYIGAIVCITGLVIMLRCIIHFAIQGKGTLSPADPTKNLVITGLYKFSRNPMYVGVILILIGETIFFKSIKLGAYTLFIFMTFNLFIIYIEEPRLRKDFGEAYTKYCKKVRRWI
jgi:protein-S-isoprenylcysteine O-methyltransferase Ste14